MNFGGPISQAVNQAIKNKTFPGCVVGVVNRNGERQILPFGNFTYDELSPKVEENTIYDTASLTKSIPTGSLALQFIDEGKLKLTDKLIDYIPEFNNSEKETSSLNIYLLIRLMVTVLLLLSARLVASP